MLKKCILLAVAVLFLAFQVGVGPSWAEDVDPALRTVKLNEQGEDVLLSMKQVVRGKRLFNDTCAQCHAVGITKTNPDVDLTQGSLELATPARDNIEGLVDYMKNPTTYDGEFEIYELHPSTRSADIYPEMRNLTEDDLVAIAGHILSQQKILGPRWGGGKTKY